MDIRYLERHADPGATGQLLCTLIDALGTARFESSMLTLARHAIRCTHLSAFSVSRTQPPRLVIAASDGASPSAHRIASKYISEYWSLDPANRVIATEPRVGQGATIRMQPREVEDVLYQRDCYLSARLVDRVSIVKSRAEQVVRLNFYRNRTQGRFADPDIDEISKMADMLIHTVSKHDALAPSHSNEDRHRQYRDRLALAAPQLTEREVQVCAGIVRGLSSAAIASSMDLSINTVLTHRRRAYEKLGVSSLNELSHMLLR